ncbi:unnamed protein product [marine sediment metagenome]|uniref:DUF551 domain-containing protein n=1 Tax=marine sediment metagenome TaxID=412755 RepID=X0VEZ2_9ZZZZ
MGWWEADGDIYFAEGGQEVMEWISVDERLPDSDGKYLCWDVPYSSGTGSPTFGRYQDNEFITDIAEDWSHVTHWMPLPKAPTTNGGE